MGLFTEKSFFASAGIASIMIGLVILLIFHFADDKQNFKYLAWLCIVGGALDVAYGDSINRAEHERREL
jgi:hypothetical protein